LTPFAVRGIIRTVQFLPKLVAAAVALSLQVSSNESKEEFLRTAIPVKAHPVSEGVTETWRVTLEGDDVTHDASFQYIDERSAVKRLPDGSTELHFVDSYRYNIAAYRLANKIGLGTMVPVSVEREWRGMRGAMTWWVDDVMGDEADIYARGLSAPDSSDWLLQTYRVRVFAALVYDTDRNQGNNLVTKDWKIWMIDFTRAFRRWDKLRRPERLVRCDRNLFRALSELTRDELESELSGILDDVELEGVWARRGLIVDHFRQAIAERGEDQVLY